MPSKAYVRVRRVPPKALGPLLRAARERMGLSQGEAARQAGIPQPYLSFIEAGRRTPSMVVAESLASTLGLTLPECRQLYAAAVDDAGRSHPARTSA
ncbi:helix-turn-helix transcriptional regulator [Streptomyces sp. NPDC093260]|uniref:helix-turn-helix domain-containing protein n=1 Tax=Streptomyces sp. NPDC093260 TaxID=3155073 RepID=UPI00343CB250